MALIDPLLRALGWDTEDPALVLPEYESSGRADYALLGGTGKPSAVIEAKKLGELQDKNRDQMSKYAYNAGIPYAGLTDGDRWEFYVCFGEPKPLKERLRLQVSISNDATHESALKLLLLWRPNLASGQPVQPTAPVLADSVELQPPPSPPAPSPSEPVSPPSSEGWVALTELGDVSRPAAPSAVRFASGAEVPIKYWKDLLAESAAWLYNKSLLNPTDCRIRSSKARYILSDSPVHPNGKPFKRDFPLPDSGIHIELNLAANQVVANTIKLIGSCGQNPAQVYVRREA